MPSTSRFADEADSSSSRLLADRGRKTHDEAAHQSRGEATPPQADGQLQASVLRAALRRRGHSMDSSEGVRSSEKVGAPPPPPPPLPPHPLPRPSDALPPAEPPPSSWIADFRRELGLSNLGGSSVTSVSGALHRRARVFNTLWRVPRRLEEMQFFAACLCCDAVLATVTTLPARALLAACRCVARRRSPRAVTKPLLEAALTDGISCAILGLTVAALFLQDVAVLYHTIRRQEVVKLFVLYSVLEMSDKLLCSFGADMLEATAGSSSRVAAGQAGAPASLALDATLLGLSVLAHAYTLLTQARISIFYFISSKFILTQALTLAVAVNSHSNALLAVLISTNFAEIKGYVFKRMDAAKVGQLACQDAVERAHLAACLLVVAAQHVQSAKSVTAGLAQPHLRASVPLVLAVEPLIDIVKHAFMAKFNDVPPAAYAEVARDMARRAQRVRAHQAHLVLGFVALAPTALLLRALPPAAAAAGWGGPGGCAAAVAVLVLAKAGAGVAARRVGAAMLRAAADAPKGAPPPGGAHAACAPPPPPPPPPQAARDALVAPRQPSPQQSHHLHQQPSYALSHAGASLNGNSHGGGGGSGGGCAAAGGARGGGTPPLHGGHAPSSRAHDAHATRFYGAATVSPAPTRRLWASGSPGEGQR